MFLFPPSCRAVGAASKALFRRVGPQAYRSQEETRALPIGRSNAALSTCSRGASRSGGILTRLGNSQISYLGKKHNGVSRQRSRAFQTQVSHEPVAGSEPGLDIQNEAAWPEWRKKAVNVRISIPHGLLACA